MTLGECGKIAGTLGAGMAENGNGIHCVVQRNKILEL
jgi:hypothetical protein